MSLPIGRAVGTAFWESNRGRLTVRPMLRPEAYTAKVILIQRGAEVTVYLRKLNDLVEILQLPEVTVARFEE